MSIRSTLNECGGIPLQTLASGTILLLEGEKTGRVYILASGRLEVLRGETQVTVLDEPGSIVGEMSILLDLPHTATVRALDDVKVHAIEDGSAFFSAHPDLSWVVARLLATRLNAATTYLVDLKRQFAGSGDHLAMVGEVLETLMHQQGQDLRPGSDRDPGFA